MEQSTWSLKNNSGLPMKIFITGGTGYIGQSVIKEGLKQQHELIVLTRSEKNAQLLREQGVQSIIGDMLEDGEWQEVINQVDAIIHLATPPTWDKKVTHREAEQFLKTHVNIAESLFNAVNPQHVKKIIFVGGSSYYGDTGNTTPRTEEFRNTPKGWGPFITPAIEYAKSKKSEYPITFVFPAQIYGPSSWLEKIFMEPVYKKRIIAGLIGHNPHFSPIHIEDCGRACLHLLEHGQIGEDYILSDLLQIPVADFRKEVLRLMDAEHKWVFAVPQWVATLVVGPVVSEYATIHTNLSSQKLRETGFELNYPTYKDGLASVVNTWLSIKKAQNENFFQRYLK